MITIYVKKAKNLKEQTKGFIGTKKPYPLLLQTRFGIHTFGLHFPIDVVILDKNNVVKKCKSNLQPNRFFFWNPRYNQVLELPIGTIEKRKIQIGTVVILACPESTL